MDIYLYLDCNQILFYLLCGCFFIFSLKGNKEKNVRKNFQVHKDVGKKYIEMKFGGFFFFFFELRYKTNTGLLCSGSKSIKKCGRNF